MRNMEIVTVSTMTELEENVKNRVPQIVISSELFKELTKNPVEINPLGPAITLVAHKIAEKNKSKIALSRLPKGTLKYYETAATKDENGKAVLMLISKV